MGNMANNGIKPDGTIQAGFGIIVFSVATSPFSGEDNNVKANGASGNDFADMAESDVFGVRRHTHRAHRW